MMYGTWVVMMYVVGIVGNVRFHTHSECKHGTYIQCNSCHEYGHKAKVCKVY
jgi:hypothetical protein